MQNSTLCFLFFSLSLVFFTFRNDLVPKSSPSKRQAVPRLRPNFCLIFLAELLLEWGFAFTKSPTADTTVDIAEH